MIYFVLAAIAFLGCVVLHLAQNNDLGTRLRALGIGIVLCVPLVAYLFSGVPIEDSDDMVIFAFLGLIELLHHLQAAHRVRKQMDTWHLLQHESSCLHCGYSLADLNTQQCPECGQHQEQIHKRRNYVGKVMDVNVITDYSCTIAVAICFGGYILSFGVMSLIAPLVFGLASPFFVALGAFAPAFFVGTMCTQWGRTYPVAWVCSVIGLSCLYALWVEGTTNSLVLVMHVGIVWLGSVVLMFVFFLPRFRARFGKEEML